MSYSFTLYLPTLTIKSFASIVKQGVITVKLVF